MRNRLKLLVQLSVVGAIGSFLWLQVTGQPRTSSEMTEIPASIAVPKQVASALIAGTQSHDKRHSVLADEGILIRDGRLHAAFRNRSLSWLIDQIARQTDMPIIPSDDISLASLSAHIDDAPLDQGLRTLLKDFDVFFLYGASEQTSLSAVWIYAKGQGRGIVPVKPETWASTRQFEDALFASDPVERALAIETVIERKGAQARDALLNALTDTDARVRFRAVAKAASAGLELPEENLRQLMQYDSSSAVRFMALQSYAESPTATAPVTKAMAELALHDRNEAVRVKAHEILDQLQAPVFSETEVQ